MDKDKDLSESEVQDAQTRVLIPETDNGNVLKIDALNITLRLRPLPIKLCRQIGMASKTLHDKFREDMATAQSQEQSLFTLATQLLDNKVTTEEYVKKHSAIRATNVKVTLGTFDEPIIGLLLNTVSKVLKFYGHDVPEQDIEEKMPVEDMLGLLEEQLRVNGANDFLLAPLRLIIALARRIPEMMIAAEKMLQSLRS